MRDLVLAQDKDIERAFTMDTVSYRLQEEYRDLGYTAGEWVKSSKQEKEQTVHLPSEVTKDQAAYLKARGQFTTGQAASFRAGAQFTTSQAAFLRTGGQFTTSQAAFLRTGGQVVGRDHTSVLLSNTGLSTSIFGDMWKKAAKLARDSTLMCNAPGLPNAKNSSQPFRQTTHCDYAQDGTHQL